MLLVVMRWSININKMWVLITIIYMLRRCRQSNLMGIMVMGHPVGRMSLMMMSSIKIKTTMVCLKCSKVPNTMWWMDNKIISIINKYRSNQNWTTPFSPYPKISNCSNKNYSTGREKRVGVRDRSSVAKYSKMPYSIHSKHYTVAHHYFPSPNMARHSYK